MSTKTSNILILGNPDIHIDTVANKLREYGAHTLHFYGWDNQQGVSIHFMDELDMPQIMIQVKEEDGLNFYDVNFFDSIWNRAKFGTKIGWLDVEDKLAHDYARSQWKEVMFSIESLIDKEKTNH